jgi:hypothetical protein
LSKQRDILLHTVAKDAAGQLVKAADSSKDGTYFCPCCDGRLILKKSGKTGKGSRRPHFAHGGDESPCSPETIVHFLAKQIVAELLRAKMSAGAPVPFTWKCLQCTEDHAGNLLKRAAAINVEQVIRNIRPDIMISDQGGNPRVAIEIVFSHPPDPEMLAFCKQQDIHVVEIHLNSDSDLDYLHELVAKPSVVRACRNPICSSCNGRQRTKKLLIVSGPCWRCQSPIRVAGIDSDYGIIGPERFSEDERRIAQSHGVIFRRRFIESYDKKVWVNNCSFCPGFVGPGHLDEQYMTPAEMGRYELEKFKIGHYCPSCDTRDEIEEIDE